MHKHYSDLNCYVKYLDSKEKYDKQFMREMKHFIESQRNICDAYFLKKWAQILKGSHKIIVSFQNSLL